MQPSGITRAAEIAYVVLILAVAGIVWREASALPPAPYDPLGPKTFPIWVSYGLAALGLAMLVRLLFGRSLGRAAQAMVVGLEDVAGEHVRRPWVAVAHADPRIRLCGGTELPQHRLPARDRGLSVPVGSRARPDRAPARRSSSPSSRSSPPSLLDFRLPHDLQARSDLKAARDDPGRRLRAPLHAQRLRHHGWRALRSASRSACCPASRPACSWR